MNSLQDRQQPKGMICLDLDGTLLNNQGKVSERNRKCLVDCLDQGFKVYLVTGRPYCFAKYIAESVDWRIGVIACAGACYEWNGQLTVHEIASEALAKIIGCLERSTAHAFFKGRSYFYTHEAYDRRFLYDHMNDRFPEKLKVRSFTELPYSELKRAAAHIHKILVYDTDSDKLHQLEAQMCRIPSLNVSRYNEISFDVTAEGTDKGTAIREIRQRLYLEKSQVLAIGDAMNDLPMFREAGRRIAMGNAKPRIKEMCHEVTRSNEEDGVAWILENRC